MIFNTNHCLKIKAIIMNENSDLNLKKEIIKLKNLWLQIPLHQKIILLMVQVVTGDGTIALI